MRDGNILLWLDTRQGADNGMELTVRILERETGRLAGQIPGQETDQAAVQDTEDDVVDVGESFVVHLKLASTFEDGEYLLEKDVKIQGNAEAVFCCPGVRLWDPEHPWLYEANVTLRQGGNVIATRQQKIGFRSLERRGKQLFWNRQAVKLKGICYRERPGDGEGTRRDLELFARGNVNFIRGIYGPFSEDFLCLCDEMGFWVENTAPFYGVGDTKPATQDLPHLKEEYLEAFREMAVLGSHTGVLIWSLGHDCAWGANFRHGAEYLRRVDPVRPLTFHLPMSIPEEEVQMDIWPVHYVNWQQPFDVCYDQMVIFHTPGAENEIGYMTGQAQYQIPVLHEVWSPVACHNRDEIERDPSIRRFWGESIRRFTEKSWRTQGCLGGAVLAGVDEDGTFENMGKYAWGILDGNHCPKPEYEQLCLAYGPVAVRNVRREGKKCFLEVENRFLFTDLSGCRLLADGVEQTGVTLEGRPGAVVTLCVEMPQPDKEITFSIVSADGSREYGRCCCEARNREPGYGEPENRGEGESGEKAGRDRNKEKCQRESGIERTGKQKSPSRWEPLEILEEEETLTVRNGYVSYIFDRESCLLTGAYVAGEQVLAGGPYLNAVGLRLGQWQGSSLAAGSMDAGDKVQVTITGSYQGGITLRFLLCLGADGMLDTSCEVLELSRHMPHVVKAQIGVSPGGLHEKGIAYLLPEGAGVKVDDGHGRCVTPGSDVGSIGPQNGWQGVNAPEGCFVQVFQPFGNVRVEDAPYLTETAMVDDRDERMQFAGSWYRMNDDCGNYRGTETLSANAGDTMRLTFVGTGVRLYGPLDINYGKCHIYLDGEQVGEADQYPDKVDLEGASRGYEKRYGQLLARIRGLEEREHILEVKVSGQKAPGAQGTYTSIDYAVLEGAGYRTGKRLNVNQDFNYTRLVRGCYQRPRVELVPGVRESIRMQLVPGGEESRYEDLVNKDCERKEGKQG